jgi:acetyltransferase-like isoleucine patch superfamily enzyme
MNQRNFKNESGLNFIFRVFKGLFGRLRGVTLCFFSFFSNESKCEGLSVYHGLRVIGSKSIFMGKGVGLGIMARLECFERGSIIFGNNSSFGDYLHIGAISRIKIGNNVLGGSNILIIDHSHGDPKNDISSEIISDPRSRKITSKGGVVIEDNVWIGDNVVILSGVTIGKGSIIGAGIIVRNDIPKRTIVKSDL